MENPKLLMMCISNEGMPKQVVKKGTLNEVPVRPGWNTLWWIAKQVKKVVKYISPLEEELIKQNNRGQKGYKLCACGCRKRGVKTEMIKGGESAEYLYLPECYELKMKRLDEIHSRPDYRKRYGKNNANTTTGNNS